MLMLQKSLFAAALNRNSQSPLLMMTYLVMKHLPTECEDRKLNFMAIFAITMLTNFLVLSFLITQPDNNRMLILNKGYDFTIYLHVLCS